MTTATANISLMPELPSVPEQSSVSTQASAVLPSAVLTPLDLIVRAQERNAPPELLDKYLDLYERWREGEAKRAYANAISLAQAEIPVIKKNCQVDYPGRSGGQVSYRHEDLAEIERTIKPVMARHGLGYRWRTRVEGAIVWVTCIVSHRDGHSEETTLPGPPDVSGSKNSIQAIGSTVTFLQRYTLKAALGLAAAEDDDGRGGKRTQGQAGVDSRHSSPTTLHDSPSTRPVTGADLANPRGAATGHPHAKGQASRPSDLSADLLQFRDLSVRATMVTDVMRAAEQVRRGRSLNEVELSLLAVWTEAARDRIKSTRGTNSNR